MINPLMLIGAIVAVGLISVISPFAVEAYRRYRHRKVFACPETHGLVEVNLDTRAAVLGAAFGRPQVRVKNCTLWPKKKGCDEKCIRENWPTP